MDTEKLKKIAGYALMTASKSENDTITSDVLQRAMNCEDVYINKMEDMLQSYGTFSEGFGDLSWHKFTLNTNGIEFSKSECEDNLHNEVGFNSPMYGNKKE